MFYKIFDKLVVQVPSTFQDYINTQLKPQRLDTLGNETLYLFGDIDPSVWAPLLDTYNQPKWKLPGHSAALSFGLAAAGTGVPYHVHGQFTFAFNTYICTFICAWILPYFCFLRLIKVLGPGFAEVIHGSKRWFLYPYDQRPEFDPDRTTLEWYTSALLILFLGI